MGDMNANLPMNGAFGEYYCAPMWAQFTAAALAGAPHPDFPVVSWRFTPWHGAHATASPLPSPSASASASTKPTPTPTATITAVPPTPTPTPTDAHAHNVTQALKRRPRTGCFPDELLKTDFIGRGVDP